MARAESNLSDLAEPPYDQKSYAGRSSSPSDPPRHLIILEHDPVVVVVLPTLVVVRAAV
jgi:hypothetical protein